MISPKHSVARLDKFFFEERPTEGIALFRILWMGILILYFLLDLTNSQDFYGPHGITSQMTVRNEFNYTQINLFNFFRPSYEVSYALLVVYGLSLVTSFLGFFTRFSLIIAFLCMTSFHQRNPWIFDSTDLLVRTMTFLLIFSPCGHSLSLDAIFGKYYGSIIRDTKWPVWSTRLIQIQVSAIYLWFFWRMIEGGSWIKGTAFYYLTRYDHLSKSPIPWVLDSKFFLSLMTWGSLLVVFSLGVLIWFRLFRKPMIILGLIFHLGIEYTLSVPYMELLLIALLVLFFTPEELKAFVDRIKSTVILGLHESTVSEKLKARIIRAVGGQRETAN